VQKTKVDVQIAMSALDQLLKSNELNFEFLAVFPTLLVVYAIVFKFRSYCRSLRGVSRRDSTEKSKKILRSLHIALSRAHNNVPISDEHVLGVIFIDAIGLMLESHYLGLAPNLRAELSEDTLMLINNSESGSSKLAALNRIVFNIWH
jgi:ATP synthase regulation protein NCA2